MNGVVMVARGTIRRRWRAIVAIGMLVGLSGAVVVASVAGARRTSTALDRFETYSRSAQFEIDAGFATKAKIDQLRHTPGVLAVAQLHQFTIQLPGANQEFLPLAASVDNRFGRVVDRPRVIDGRLPHPSAPLELTIGETLAARLHLHVGSVTTWESYSDAQIQRAFATNGNPGRPNGPKVHFRIVGIVRRPLDLGVRGGPGGVVVPSVAFYERYRDRIGSFGGEILRVRARPTKAVARVVTSKARRLFGDSFAYTAQALGAESQGAADAIDVLAIALWIFAGIALLAGLVTVAIVVSRQIASDDADQPVLAAMGLTTGERAIGAAAFALPVALLGGAVAILVAALLSPLLPFGIARKADVDAGFHVDALAFVLGVVGLIGAVLVIGLVAGWRAAAAGPAGPRPRPSAAARIAEEVGVTPPVAAGVRLALEPGRGRRSVPVRTAVTGAALAVVGVVATLVFASSLDRLVASPKQYGYSFDALVRPSSYGPQEVPLNRQCSAAPRDLAENSTFSSLAVLCLLSVDVDGRGLQAWAFHSVRGSIKPSIIDGREPSGRDEVALGAATQDAIGKHIGDWVRIRERRAPLRFHVVGTAVFPSPQSFDAQPLADGVAMSTAGMLRLAKNPDDLNSNLVADLAGGIDPRSLPSAGKGIKKIDGGVLILPAVPVEIARIQQLDNLPTVLGALLALLGLASVAHAIALAVSRRRHDLAVLRTLGFRRSQVRDALLSQAATLAVLGLVVGIPLGLAVGRLIWDATADSVGIAHRTTLPVLGSALTAIGALAACALLGLVGGHQASRSNAAAILRSE